MPRSILFVFVFALVSCHATPPAPPKASWAEVIQKLRQCLDEFPKRAPDGFISPCAYSDVSSLNGINRNELITAFGGVPACYSHKPMPKDITTRLGGPLLCEIDDDPFLDVLRTTHGR